MNYTKTALALGSALGIRELIKSVEALDLNDILGIAGLERSPSSVARILPAIGLVAVSAAVGAGAALLLAPSAGSKLRAQLSDGLDDAKHRLSDTISQFERTSQNQGRHAAS
jgi:YtxH-like protein